METPEHLYDEHDGGKMGPDTLYEIMGICSTGGYVDHCQIRMKICALLLHGASILYAYEEDTLK
jgi:hypothetical protein